MPSPFYRIKIRSSLVYPLLLCTLLGTFTGGTYASPMPLPDSLQKAFSALENTQERRAWLNQQISIYTSQNPPLGHTLMLLLATEFDQVGTTLDSAIAIQLRAKAAFLGGEGTEAFEKIQQSVCILEKLDAPFHLARSYFISGLIAAGILRDHSLAAMYDEVGLEKCPESHPKLRGSLLNNFSAALINSGQAAKAALILEEEIAGLDSTSEDFQFRWTWLQNTLGAAYHDLGRRQEALAAYQNALLFARKGKNKNLIGSAAMNVGMMFVELEAPSQAMLYLKEAEEAFQDFSSIFLLQVYEYLCKAHLMQDSLDAAEADLLNMNEAIEKMGQMRFKASMHTSEVRLWTKRNQPQKAIEMANACLAHLHPHTQKEEISLELLILESYLSLVKNPDIPTSEINIEQIGPQIPSPATLEAIADTLLTKAMDAGMFKELKRIYTALAQFHQQQGNISRALEMNQMTKAMADSMLPASEFAQLQAATFEFEVQQRDKELQQQQVSLQAQKTQLAYQRQRTYWLFSLVSTLTLLILTGGGFLYGRMKLNRKLKATNQELRGANIQLKVQSEKIKTQSSQVQQQSEIILAQKNALQEELAFRERELASREVLRHRNERLLEALEKDFQDISPYVQPAGRFHLKEAQDKLRHVPKGTRDWEAFREQFERIHPNFFQHLTQHHPKLSPVDLRQCAYIRLGMDKHEMANLLNLTTRGVESARYRIRKKMELKKGRSLDNYLQSLG